MTDTRAVPMDIHHHLGNPKTAVTCINLAGVSISIEIRRDLTADQEADLLAVLDRMHPLMDQLWADPDRDGPMVMDLRGRRVMSAVPERWRQLGAEGLVHALRGLDREGDRQIIATLVLRPVLADLRDQVAELVADLREMDRTGAIQLDRWPAAQRLIEWAGAP